QARASLRRGDVAAAQRELVQAQRARPLLTYAIPHIAVHARIELAHVHLGLGDLAGARTLVREIDELLRRRPGLGALTGPARAQCRRGMAPRAGSGQRRAPPGTTAGTRAGPRSARTRSAAPPRRRSSGPAGCR